MTHHSKYILIIFLAVQSFFASANGVQLEKELIQAAKVGDAAMVDALLKAGADVRYRDEFDSTALMWAARLGHAEIIYTLIEAGADANTSCQCLQQFSLLPCVNYYGGGLITSTAFDPIYENLLKVEKERYCAFDNRMIFRKDEVALVEITRWVFADEDDDQTNQWAPWMKNHTALFEAAGLGHDGAVQALIEGGAQVDAPNDWSWTPLMTTSLQAAFPRIKTAIICLRSKIDQQAGTVKEAWLLSSRLDTETIVRRLIAAGADVNGRTRWGHTPLMGAAQMGKTVIVRLLIDKGAQVDAVDQRGFSALIYAASSGERECLHQLMEAGADFDCSGEGGYSALSAAVSGGHLPAVRELVAAGADLNLSKGSANPVYIAAGNGNCPLLQYLIRSGADVNTVTDRGYGWTPLAIAAKMGHADAVRLLLESGADVNVPDEDGGTILQTILPEDYHYFNDGEMARLLVMYGAEAQAGWNLKGKLFEREAIAAASGNDISAIVSVIQKNTPAASARSAAAVALFWAVRERHGEVVPKLIRFGADVDSTDELGQTALAWAAYLGEQDTVRQLLRLKAKVDAGNLWGETPLILAVRQNQFEAARELIAAGAGVDLTDREEDTPLQWAIRQENDRMVQLLLAAGADVNKTCRGSTPLMLAASGDCVEIVRSLLDAGADVHFRNESGRTAMDMTDCNGNEMVILLLSQALTKK